MTITIQPMDATAGSPAYSAQHERQAFAALFGAGSGRPLGARSGFRVDTPSNLVTITTSPLQWNMAAASAIIDAQFATAQGAYRWSSDTTISGSITPADGTNPRVDIVYIQINDSSAGDGSGALSGNVYYLAGAAAPSPVAPPLPATPSQAFLVATINVPKSGAGSPTATLNTARVAAAGGILPVGSDSEAAGLVQSQGLAVAWTDGLVGVSNGSAFIERTESLALAPPDSGWSSVSGGLFKVRTHGGKTLILMDFVITRSSAGTPTFTYGTVPFSLLTGYIPVGWRPSVVTDMQGVLDDNTGAIQDTPIVRVGTDGTIAVRSRLGAGNISPTTGWYFCFKGSWTL